jgi:hypothetical protein
VRITEKGFLQGTQHLCLVLLERYCNRLDTLSPTGPRPCLLIIIYLLIIINNSCMHMLYFMEATCLKKPWFFQAVFLSKELLFWPVLKDDWSNQTHFTKVTITWQVFNCLKPIQICFCVKICRSSFLCFEFVSASICFRYIILTKCVLGALIKSFLWI